MGPCWGHMFESSYDVVLADSPAGRQIHYAIRYQVYCLEKGWEDPSVRPDRMERDGYDETSAHFLVRCRATGQWIATMRLIVAPFDQLPINRVARIDTKKLPGLTDGLTAEISRLCVIGEYMRHPRVNNPEAKFFFGPKAHSAKQISPVSPPSGQPWLTLGLIRAAREYSRQNGIRYWFFLISDPLARIVQRLGLGLQLIGPECDHRGKRRPYLRDLAAGYHELPLKSPKAYKFFLRTPSYLLFSSFEEESLPQNCDGLPTLSSRFLVSTSDRMPQDV